MLVDTFSFLCMDLMGRSRSDMGRVLAIWNGALVLGLVTKFREGFDGGAGDAIIG